MNKHNTWIVVTWPYKLFMTDYTFLCIEVTVQICFTWLFCIVCFDELLEKFLTIKKCSDEHIGTFFESFIIILNRYDSLHQNFICGTENHKIVMKFPSILDVDLTGKINSKGGQSLIVRIKELISQPWFLTWLQWMLLLLVHGEFHPVSNSDQHLDLSLYTDNVDNHFWYKIDMNLLHFSKHIQNPQKW